MIRTSAPFASWILQRQLTEMKEAAVSSKSIPALLLRVDDTKEDDLIGSPKKLTH